MTSARALWVVCPVYFDVDSFLTLRDRIRGELAALGSRCPQRCRLVVVDDSGGQDPDIERLDGLADVVVMPVPFNLGHQGALVFGLRRLAPIVNADDWVVTLDADGEDKPEDLPRMLKALAAHRSSVNHLVLALRAKRKESVTFKFGYFFFKLLFRLMTGTMTRTGNFAAFHGRVAKTLLFHPYFDLSYSSALIALNIPATFVPCDRGRRYAGESKMNFSRLMMHGLRMLMPFVDRLTIRALIAFGTIFGLGLGGSLVVVGDVAFGFWTLPDWMWVLVLAIVSLSLTGLVSLVILFVVFVHFRSLSLSGLHAQAFVGDRSFPDEWISADAPAEMLQPVGRGPSTR